ncbi:MAG: PilZ domain-containing protein, partial [candidate division NC10 bacterium]
MPNPSDRRRFHRYPVQLPLVFMAVAPAPAKRGAGWTRSLSEGGATVELAERLRPQLSLRVRLQTDRGAIEAEVQVVWIGGRAPEGGGILHGLAFTRIAPEYFQTLCDVLLPLAMRRQAGIRLPLGTLR